MTYILEVNVFDAEGNVDDSTTRSFKTLAGATNAGIKALSKMHKRAFYGYQAASRFEGDSRWPRHVVAEWFDTRNGKRVLLAKVWV
jgi:hypothetical protein